MAAVQTRQEPDKNPTSRLKVRRRMVNKLSPIILILTLTILALGVSAAIIGDSHPYSGQLIAAERISSGPAKITVVTGQFGKPLLALGADTGSLFGLEQLAFPVQDVRGMFRTQAGPGQDKSNAFCEPININELIVNHPALDELWNISADRINSDYVAFAQYRILARAVYQVVIWGWEESSTCEGPLYVGSAVAYGWAYNTILWLSADHVFFPRDYVDATVSITRITIAGHDALPVGSDGQVAAALTADIVDVMPLQRSFYIGEPALSDDYIVSYDLKLVMAAHTVVPADDGHDPTKKAAIYDIGLVNGCQVNSLLELRGRAGAAIWGDCAVLGGNSGGPVLVYLGDDDKSGDLSRLDYRLAGLVNIGASNGITGAVRVKEGIGEKVRAWLQDGRELLEKREEAKQEIQGLLERAKWLNWGKLNSDWQALWAKLWDDDVSYVRDNKVSCEQGGVMGFKTDIVEFCILMTTDFFKDYIDGTFSIAGKVQDNDYTKYTLYAIKGTE